MPTKHVEGAMSNWQLPAEVTAAFAVVSTIAGWLPGIAALLAVVWYLVMLYEYWRAKRGKPVVIPLPFRRPSPSEPED